MDSSWQMEQPQPDKMSQTSGLDFMSCLAAQGHELSKSLLGYGAVSSSRDHYAVDFAGAASTTAVVLSSFAPSSQPVEGNTIRALCLGVKSIFEHVEEALKDVETWEKAQGDEEEEKDKILWPGDKLIEELGGINEAEPLYWRLEGLRVCLVCVFDSIKFLELKKGEKEGTLDDSQNAELKKMIKRLPIIVDDLKTRKRALLGTAEEILDGKDWGKMKVASKSPLITSRNIDDDVVSIRSFDSLASNLSAFVDETEVYEYWILQRMEGENMPRRTWGILGLKVTERFEETGYSVEGRPRSQKELRARDEEAKTDDEKAKRDASIRKTLAAMPHRLQVELELILRDRDRTSCNSSFIRDWNVVDLRPIKSKINTPARSWGAWWKGQGGNTEWECVIKGSTLGTAKDGEHMRTPNRFSDPFRKPVPPRSRRYVDDRRRPVMIEERRRPAPMIRVQERGDPPFVPPDLPIKEMEEKVTKLLATITIRGEGDAAN